MVSSANFRVFDGDFLRKLEQLELLAKKIFRGQLRGEHSVPRRGRGLEFADYRRYQPGDDLRYIDWNIFSRLDRLFLKLYATEEDLTLHLLLDASASMGFGEPRKFDYARQLTAALAYIGLNNLDRVGITTFSDCLGVSLPPIKTKHHMATLLPFLETLECNAGTQFVDALRDFSSRARNPGIVVVIADLLGHEDIDVALDALRRRGHDVVVIQLLSEDEIDPPLDGVLTLVDAETNHQLKITIDPHLREIYHNRLDTRLAQLESYCRKAGMDYLRVSTVIPFEDVVLKYLRQGTVWR